MVVAVLVVAALVGEVCEVDMIYENGEKENHHSVIVKINECSYVTKKKR